jgi:Tfp pilus assembly protein PilV
MILLRLISRYSRPRKGHSLVDVLIGITVLAIALGSAFSLAAHNARIMQRNQQMAAASLLAQSKLEELRNQTFANIVTGADPGTLNAQGDPDGIFSRTWTVTNNTPMLNSKTIAVTVTWEQWGEPRTFTLNGVVAQ